jgi:hypothetical protein
MNGSTHVTAITIERGSGMTVLEFAARFVLGGIFLVFAADYVFHFLPELPFTDAGGRYLEALVATGFMFPLIKSVEVTGALLILHGRLAPLGVLIVAPVVLNIVLYHTVLDPNGSTVAWVLVVAEVFLLWRYRAAYRSLFTSGPIAASVPVAAGSTAHTAPVRS